MPATPMKSARTTSWELPPGDRALPKAQWYWGLFCVALVLRALHVVEMRSTPLWGALIGDGRQYDLWAQEIAHGNWLGHEVFYQAPLYPYFLAVIYKIFGHSLLAVRAIQIILGSCSCVLLAAGGARFFSPRIGLLAGVLLAIYPVSIYYDFLLQKSVLDVFSITLLVALLGRLDQRGWRGWELFSGGVALGCLVLTRENALVLIPVVLVWLMVRFAAQPLALRFRVGLIFLGGLVLVLGPVALRNEVLGGKFLLTTAQSGPNFYIGNSRTANGGYVPLVANRGDAEVERLDATLLAQSALGRRLTPGEVSRYWWDQSLAYVRAQPLRWSGLLLRKWLLVWNAAESMDADSLDLHREYSRVLRILRRVHFGVVAPLAVAGLWAMRSDWRRWWVLVFMALALAGSIAFFYVLSRYRYCLVPIVMLFAAAGLVELWTVLKERQLRRAGQYLVLVGAAAVAVNWPMTNPTEELATAHCNLGVWFDRRDDSSNAAAQYRRALELCPGLATAANNLAWIYATDPRVQFRNGAAAVRLANQACMSTGFAEPNFLDTLAAALAESGRFDEAIQAVQKALALAAGPTPGNAELRTKLEHRLTLYKSKQPYRTENQEPQSKASSNRLSDSHRPGCSPRLKIRGI